MCALVYVSKVIPTVPKTPIFIPSVTTWGFPVLGYRRKMLIFGVRTILIPKNENPWKTVVSEASYWIILFKRFHYCRYHNLLARFQGPLVDLARSHANASTRSKKYGLGGLGEPRVSRG